jgi:hypothetical protein
MWINRPQRWKNTAETNPGGRCPHPIPCCGSIANRPVKPSTLPAAITKLPAHPQVFPLRRSAEASDKFD